MMSYPLQGQQQPNLFVPLQQGQLPGVQQLGSAPKDMPHSPGSLGQEAPFLLNENNFNNNSKLNSSTWSDFHHVIQEESQTEIGEHVKFIDDLLNEQEPSSNPQLSQQIMQTQLLLQQQSPGASNMGLKQGQMAK